MQTNEPSREAGAAAPPGKQWKFAHQGKKKAHQGRRKNANPNVPAGAVTLDRLPLIYLNVPKSACTTIKNHLYFAEHGRYIDEPLAIHANGGLQRSRERTEEATEIFAKKLKQPHLVFTFVRHPGKRAYSCFSEKIFHESKYSFPKIRDYIVKHHHLKLPAKLDANYDLACHRANFMRFLDFVQANFAGSTDVRVDAHWNLQTSIIEHFQRFFLIDFIGRVETFEAQFEFVLDQFSLPHRPDIGVRFNEGPKPPFSYEQIADEEVESRLREIYASDYQLLGYAANASFSR